MKHIFALTNHKGGVEACLCSSRRTFSTADGACIMVKRPNEQNRLSALLASVTEEMVDDKPQSHIGQLLLLTLVLNKRLEGSV